MQHKAVQIIARAIGIVAIIFSVPQFTDDRLLWVMIGLIVFFAWVAEPLDRFAALGRQGTPLAESVSSGEAARSSATALLVLEALLAVIILLRVRGWI